MSSRILLLSEVAERLRVHKVTLYKLVNKGGFPGAFRVGGEWRFTEEGLLELENGRTGSTAPGSGQDSKRPPKHTP